MKHHKISIITVCYNAEINIETTIKSALSQTYPNKEIVIIDGLSSDQTLSIVNNYKSQIQTIISEKDKGIYDAMNKGIHYATGDWLYFLNAGDVFYNNEVLSNIFSNSIDEHVGLIYGKVQTINEPSGVNYLFGKNVTIRDFYFRYPINHQSAFTHKNAFKEIGTYNTQYKLVADTEWFVRFFKQQKLKPLHVNLIITYYDILGASYYKRLAGYREYVRVSKKYFPTWIYLKNILQWPLIWIKVKIIRLLEGNRLFAVYRKIKSKNI